MTRESWIRAGIFAAGLLIGSMVFPSPHYKTNAPGVVLNTWSGELSHHYEKREANDYDGR